MRLYVISLAKHDERHVLAKTQSVRSVGDCLRSRAACDRKHLLDELSLRVHIYGPAVTDSFHFQAELVGRRANAVHKLFNICSRHGPAVHRGNRTRCRDIHRRVAVVDPDVPARYWRLKFVVAPARIRLKLVMDLFHLAQTWY